MRHVLLHYHIYKNAGTTIAWTLARNFSGSVRHFETGVPGRRAPAEVVESYIAQHVRTDAFTSHSAAFPTPGSSPRVHVHPIIAIRHPIDRAGSIYRFDRKRRDDSPGTEAARRSFGEYVDFWLSRPASPIADHQTAFCTPAQSDDGDGDDRAFWHRDLGAAKRTLESCAGGVIVVDRFDLSLVCAEALLCDVCRDLDLSYISQNVLRDPSESLDRRIRELEAELGPERSKRLRERNALDLELYDFARTTLERTATEVPSVEAKVDAFRLRCRQNLEDRSLRRLRIPRRADWDFLDVTNEVVDPALES